MAYPVNPGLLTDGTKTSQSRSGFRRVEQMGACVLIVVALATGLGLLEWLPALIAG